MEGRTIVVCGDCGRTAEVAGEMPREYRDAFTDLVEEAGWMPRPGSQFAMVCGVCAAQYEGSETRDDEEKVRRSLS